MIRTLEGHTMQRYDGELNNLHLKVVEMGGLVLDQVRLGLSAITEKNPVTTETVLEREQEVHELEVGIDEDVITVVAKRGPVARDLRVIMSVSKSVIDLQRVGDEAVRIAKVGRILYGSEHSPPGDHLLRDVRTMGHQAIATLDAALASFDALDVTGAEALLCRENELDIEFQSSLRRLATFVLEDARNVGHAIHIVLLIKAIERIGDHARNIAEYVIFMVHGEDVRHRPGSYRQPGDHAGNSGVQGDARKH